MGMRIVVLNASSKKKGGASRCFSRILKLMLAGCQVTTVQVRNQSDHEDAFTEMEKADAVILSAPLYIDGIPAHLLEFLQRAEMMCREKNCSFRLYVLSNGGFVEGRQNKIHLKMYEAWCRHAGVTWGGGLGIGGGTILHVFCILLPILFVLRLIQVAAILWTNGGISGGEIWNCMQGLCIYVFFLLGLLLHEGIMAFGIRKGRTMKNHYTRVWMPSFLFLIGADIFMLLAALCNGTLPHKLFRKVYPDTEKNE